MREIVEKLCRIEDGAGTKAARQRTRLARLQRRSERKHEKQLAFPQMPQSATAGSFGGKPLAERRSAAPRSASISPAAFTPTAKTDKGPYAAGSSPSPRRCSGTSRRGKILILPPPRLDRGNRHAERHGRTAPKTASSTSSASATSFGGISAIGFKSCDQGREKFQGASLDFVWFDEEPPRTTSTRNAACASSTAAGSSSGR